MYVKVFAQILDSSIAEDHLVRWVFEDLLKLADKDGLVDMTPSAIARRTNVPLEIVTRGLDKLMETDPTSRSLDEDGRRIVLIDPHRPWGWRIVNYLHYRAIRDGEERKAYFRERKREQRAQCRTVQDKEGHSQNVTQAEAEAEATCKKQRSNTQKRGNSPRARVSAIPSYPLECEDAAERLIKVGLGLSPTALGISQVAAQIENEAAKFGGADEAAAAILRACNVAKIVTPYISPTWIGSRGFAPYLESPE